MTYDELLAEIDAIAFFAHQSGELGEAISTEALMERRDIVRAELQRLYALERPNVRIEARP